MDNLERKIIQITSYAKPVDFICKGHFAYNGADPIDLHIKYCELPELVGNVDCKYLAKNMKESYCMHQTVYTSLK